MAAKISFDRDLKSDTVLLSKAIPKPRNSGLMKFIPLPAPRSLITVEAIESAILGERTLEFELDHAGVCVPTTKISGSENDTFGVARCKCSTTVPHFPKSS